MYIPSFAWIDVGEYNSVYDTTINISRTLLLCSPTLVSTHPSPLWELLPICHRPYQTFIGIAVCLLALGVNSVVTLLVTYGGMSLGRRGKEVVRSDKGGGTAST